MLIHSQNLGLGVLEADPEGDTRDPSGDSHNNEDNKSDQPQDVMDKLLGREQTNTGVRVVEEQEAR
jgi:hypothetical protein